MANLPFYKPNLPTNTTGKPAGPLQKPTTNSNEDGLFNINIPSKGLEEQECPGFVFIAGALYVPDNIKYNQPTEVPIIVSSDELTKWEYQHYVIEQNFKFKNFTLAEQEVIKKRIIEDELTSDERCINDALGIITSTPPPNYLLAENGVQLRIITGKVVAKGYGNDNEIMDIGIPNSMVYTSKNSDGLPIAGNPRTKSLTGAENGFFKISIPKDTKYISARIKYSDVQFTDPTKNFQLIVSATENDMLIGTTELNPTQDNYLITLDLQRKPSLPPKPPKLLITAEGYESMEIIPYKGDGTPKKDMGVLPLVPLKTSVEEDSINISRLTEGQINTLTGTKRDAKYFTQKRLDDLIQNLKDKILPMLLTLIADFGMSKISELKSKGTAELQKEIENKSFCPPQDVIDNVIKRKNNLVKILNQTLKLINSVTKTLGLFGKLVDILNVTFIFLKTFPVPLVGGMPISVPLLVQDNKKEIEKVIRTISITNKSLLTTLVILRETLIQILELLNMLDLLIQHCSPDNEQTQTQVSEELRNLANEQSQENNAPIIIEANGFKMDIETEKTEKTLKRKRAIAKDPGGVTVLKGEWSFSSVDQILIDELVFYIENNNLKAD